MSRFVLSYAGDGAKPQEDVTRLKSDGSITVLDESLPRTILVEGSEDALRGVFGSRTDWSIAAEKTYQLPGPHPAATRLRKPARKPRGK